MVFPAPAPAPAPAGNLEVADQWANLRLIALVGLPAVGKSTIGRRLAALLGRAFYDTDDVVEATTGRSIASIFEQDGELRFRDFETRALEQIEQLQEASVIATGGGIVTAEPSRRFLTNRTFAVYLRSPPGRLLTRLGRSNRRPMFRSGDVAKKIADLHTQRDPLYRAVARLEVDVDRLTTASLVLRILERLPHVSPGPDAVSQEP